MLFLEKRYIQLIIDESNAVCQICLYDYLNAYIFHWSNIYSIAEMCVLMYINYKSIAGFKNKHQQSSHSKHMHFPSSWVGT